MLAPNLIVPFRGSVIPDNFVDVSSSYLDKYIMLGLGADGGASTHSHTLASHTHTMANHSHTGSTGVVNGSTWSAGDASSDDRCIRSHTHTYTSGAISGGVTGDISSQSCSSVSNEVPYIGVKLIKSVGYNMIPVNSIILRTAQDRSGGLSVMASDTYMRVSSSDGGSNTHNHNFTHAHYNSTHSHVSVQTSTTGIAGAYLDSPSTSGHPTSNHTHTTTFSSESVAVNEDISASNNSWADTLPSYINLVHYLNDTADPILAAVGDIFLLEQADDVPIGWEECDGSGGTPDLYQNSLIRTGTALATGGSATHTHSNLSHSHTAPSHTHTASFALSDATGSWAEKFSASSPYRDHSHISATTSVQTANYSTESAVINSANSMPPYTQLRAVRATLAALSGGGAIMLA